MMKLLKKILLSLLLLFQILPVIILIYFLCSFNRPTENPGWIFDEDTGCKFYSSINFENRTFTWNGDCLEGIAHGYGVLTLFQNSYKHYIFEGFLSNGKFEGEGKLTFLSDGDTYEGDFENNALNGFGHFYNDDGDHYEGDFIAGLKSGHGTYWYPPESPVFKYVGEWKEGKENGKGTLFYRNGNKVSGNFKEGILVTEHIVK